MIDKVYVFRVAGSPLDQFVKADNAEAAMSAAIAVAGSDERVQGLRRATAAEESQILAEWKESD